MTPPPLWECEVRGMRYFVLHLWRHEGSAQIIAPMFREPAHAGSGEHCALVRYERGKYFDSDAVPGEWHARAVANLYAWLQGGN